MIPEKVTEFLNEYISQEVYVQIAVIKGKEKVSTKSAINKYFNSNHFKDLSDGKPYSHFIDGLRDKCLNKLINILTQITLKTCPKVNLLIIL